MKCFPLMLSLAIVFSILSCKSQIYSTKLDNSSSLIVHDTTFVNLKDYDADFVLDMKYATDDNFLKSKVYECGSCYLRYKTVKNLVAANKKFKEKGFKIKLFDCYRPLDVQKKMWAIVPNPNYVANPTKGSIHNRGGAVDITLINANGIELDMGTTFDFFGSESSHEYKDFSEEILKNRRFLKKIMSKYNFESFDSEWWHYNLKGSRKDKIANSFWKCQ